MPRTGRPAARRIGSVERAIVVLDALAGQDSELGTNELSRRTGLNASTVSRLLATLEADALVEHVPESGRYRLGLRLLQLGNLVAARLDIREAARPHLEALAQETGETATLSAPAEPDAVTVDFVQSTALVQGVAQLGRPSVAHATATGKVLLAFGDRELPAAPLETFTPRTIDDLAVLAREVRRVRERGWAEAVEEREPGLTAVAAPVFEAAGSLAAIVGLQGPSARFGAAPRRAARVPLRAHAAAISERLGFTP